MFNSESVSKFLSDWGLLLLIWIVLIVGFAVAYIAKKSRQSHSVSTMKSVTSQLRTRGRLLEWNVMSDIELKDEKGGATADQLVVGPFGVLIVCDVHIPGNYYGDPDSENWIVNSGDEKEGEVRRLIVENPLLRCRAAEAAARRKLSAAGIYNMAIDTVVAASNKDVCMFITGARGRILDRKEFRQFIGEDKFGTDNGVDVARVSAALSGK